jgi:Tfp pilus assembly PilM family ATPase
MKEINNENTNYILKYAKNNPDSYISAVALNSILSIPTVPKDTIRNIYNNFSDYVKKGDISREIEFFLQTSEPIHLDSILTH